MKKIITALCLVLLGSTYSQQRYHTYVNPMIGTGGHGHTFPGATVPFGMVQLSPDTRIDGSWDGCSGYHYDDKVIYGFSHTHLNGTGCTDYGDIMLMPTMGKGKIFSTDYYASPFSHANEKATAGYYSVKLDKHNIDVQLTASTRVGFHEYTFNQSGEAVIVLNLNHRDKLLFGEIRVLDDHTVEVLRRSEAWAKDQYVYARIEFNAPMKIAGQGNVVQSAALFSGTEVGAYFTKNVTKGEKLKVKVSLSPTSYEGAQLNMSEIKGWDFNKVKQNAAQLWDQQLAKIAIKEADKDKLAIFYTALYHTMVQPNIAQDIDGRYRGRDNQIHEGEGFDYYTVFSLWDTFRGAHPLYTLIDKKRTADFINTFLKEYAQGGRLPVWELASNETDCMIGYHSVSVMADAMAKGITGFDYEKAFEAAKHSAMLDHLGLYTYKKQGFLSMDDEHESVSKTVEYAYDDWCIAQMAQIVGKTDDYEYFMKRSQSWKNLFDWNTGFMRPKKNGGWDKPFDPREINNNFTEGNSWQYSFFVPQDIPGMIEVYGGAAKFEAKLDALFNSESKTTGREQADVTGLIGQYAHGNEPSHHMAYLYNYVGKPEKTAAKVHYILDNFYKNAPDGLIGNEDCGQMSAWYVLTSMGIYAVTPGSGEWTATPPYFKDVTINFEDHTSKNLATQDKIQLKYFGVKPEKLESGEFDYILILPVPIIQADKKSFKDQMTVVLDANPAAGKLTLKYKIDYDGSPAKDFVTYSQPFEINQSCRITAFAENALGQSKLVFANYIKKPNNYTIAIKSVYNPQYHAGGSEGLIDGIFGTENWRKGDWQGYQGQDFECVVDLQKQQPIQRIEFNTLQDSRSWILCPKKVEFYVSDDNEHFTLIKTVDSQIDPKADESQLVPWNYDFTGVQGRYVKVIAYNFGTLPDWHQGAGGDAFIFVDEITIK